MVSYVDHLVTGEESFQTVEKMKSDSIEECQKGGFKFHKWHSNEPNLETNDLSSQTSSNFAEEHLGTKANETNIRINREVHSEWKCLKRAIFD